jgi:hypothetical protein
MSDRNDPRDPQMDATSLYREEIITDRRIGTIRMMTPLKADGGVDPSRNVLFVGEAQMMTSMGALPISFEIEATSLAEAVEQYGAAAKEGFQRAVRELQEMRREAASSIVLPPPGSAGAFSGGGGMGGMGGLGGGGKIQLP